MKKIKLEFTRNYTPRKKGEVVTFEGKDGLKLAEHYLSIGAAEETDKEVKDCNCGKEAGEGKAKAKLNQPETVALVEALDSLEALEAYKDDTRQKVKAAYDLKFAELTEASSSDEGTNDGKEAGEGKEGTDLGDPGSEVE